VRGNTVDGVAPTFEAIADGSYGISRALYFYVKKAHVGRVPGLKEFIAAFLSDAAASEDGYLADKGLIPLEDAERAAVRKSATALNAFALK
jgi:phosphate transport system substrate-binding protein